MKWARWAAWLAVLALVTTGLLLGRERFDKAHVSLLFLIVVFAGSLHGGRSLGLLLAVAAFTCLNLFFLPPYLELTVSDPLDWLVLAVFLGVSVVATELIGRVQQHRARLAAQAQHAESLREADRVKDALLASVSHDLRTPLTTIKAHAFAIAADGDERALVIAEETDRLTRFVTDLLDLSRMNGGVLQVTPELVAADDIAGALIERFSGVPGQARVQVSLDTTHPLLVGRFDFTHTLRIMSNLLENALKFSPPTAPVEVTIVREGDHLVLAVCDRGPGIAPSEAGRVFSPFHRPAGTPPDASGAGLGLSIAKRLAMLQGGDLSYESREGGGTRFRLRLPAADLHGSEGFVLPP